MTVPAEPPPWRLQADVGLVRRLVAAQFPQWAGLEVWRVAAQGWDNCTFHLGDSMSVRLPTAAPYALAVEKEHRWLPKLAPLLPVPIPVPLGLGEPGEGYPHAWSVYRWLDGEPATTARIDEPTRFATDVADFLVALRRIDAADGPPPDLHNWYRGGPPHRYDAETREALARLDGVIATDLAAEIWELALASAWRGDPVWFHGDVATGNLLVTDGRLSGVIDFGTSGVGDPACDTVIAWTFLSGDARQAFRDRLGVDDDTWARGRGWALWKALIGCAGALGTDPERFETERRVLDEIFAEFASG